MSPGNAVSATTSFAESRPASVPSLARGLATAPSLALALLLVGCTHAPRHVAAPHAHFDGERFKNLAPGESRNLWDVLKWQLGPGEATPWPEWVEARTFPPPPMAVDDGVRVTFVNHATLLVQFGGTNILTDPVWSERVGPTSWLGPARHQRPGVAFDALPRIHAVVLSHNHYDHFDEPTLRRLVERDMPLLIGGLGTGKLLEALGLGQARAQDLDWWQSRNVRGVEITFAPAQHTSMRTLSDRDHTLWGSFFMKSKSRSGKSQSVYFAGDTAMGPHFRMVRERLGAPTVALLPIGAYRPRWFMRVVHIDPFEAVMAHRELGAQKSVGMHWGTFDQADEGMDEPPLDLARACAAARLEPRAFVALEHGDHVYLPSSR